MQLLEVRMRGLPPVVGGGDEKERVEILEDNGMFFHGKL